MHAGLQRWHAPHSSAALTIFVSGEAPRGIAMASKTIAHPHPHVANDHIYRLHSPWHV
jgi:hypothetical protein